MALHRIASALIISALTATASWSDSDVFPSGAWGDAREIEVSWYEDILTSFAQGRLSKARKTAGAVFAMRVTVAPSFHGARVALIFEMPDGTLRYVYQRQNGAAGYDRGGDIIAQRQGRVRDTAAENLKARIATIDPFGPTTPQSLRIETQIAPDGGTILFLCSDGASVLFEFSRPMAYRLVERNGCDLEGRSPHLLALAWSVHEATGRHLLPHWYFERPSNL